MIGGIISGIASSFFGVFGKTLTDIHADNTTRYKNEGSAGNELAGTIARSAADAGAQRADVQKAQGTWGPFGIAGFVIALTFAFYTWLIVMDSTSWHISLTTRLWVIPWLEWREHVVGSWKVAKLPAELWVTYLRILEALFYVGPPSAALVIAAKAFRR